MSPVNRRALIRGAAWSAPVILATSAVPAYAASSCPPVEVTARTSSTSAGDTLYTVRFTAPQAWGQAAVEVSGGHLISEPETVSHINELEVAVIGQPGLRVILQIAGCAPVAWEPTFHQEEVDS